MCNSEGHGTDEEKRGDASIWSQRSVRGLLLAGAMKVTEIGGVVRTKQDSRPEHRRPQRESLTREHLLRDRVRLKSERRSPS